MLRHRPGRGGDLAGRLICDRRDHWTVFLSKMKVILCLLGIILGGCLEWAAIFSSV